MSNSEDDENAENAQVGELDRIAEKFIEEINFFKVISMKNTSLAAQGSLAQCLQHCPMPIHDNANSGAHPSWPSLDFNLADEAWVHF